MVISLPRWRPEEPPVDHDKPGCGARTKRKIKSWGAVFDAQCTRDADHIKNDPKSYHVAHAGEFAAARWNDADPSKDVY